MNMDKKQSMKIFGMKHCSFQIKKFEFVDFFIYPVCFELNRDLISNRETKKIQ